MLYSEKTKQMHRLSRLKRNNPVGGLDVKIILFSGTIAH
jgi:hypothetical protein